MKKRSALFVLLIGLMFGCAKPSSFISFNIRYNNPNDKDNSWDNRKNEVVAFINKYHPDIIGLQEAVKSQVNMIDKSLPDYQFIGIGRDDGRSKGEHTAIFYNTSKFKLIKNESFWLSETPEKVSVGWDAALSRICTYGAFFRTKEKDTVHIFNTHYDHRGRISREKASELIVNRIRQYNLLDKKVIVMGDLNSTPTYKSIRTLKTILDDGAEISKSKIIGPQGTFTGFNIRREPTRRIDYIFTKNLKVSKYEHVNEKRENGLWLSDHLPILIEIEN